MCDEAATDIVKALPKSKLVSYFSAKCNNVRAN
jgi:hypothetical protein